VALLATTSDAADVIDALEAAVGAGRLELSRVDDAVTHLFTVKGLDPCKVDHGG
jgi:hypothetical protein